MFYKDSDFLFIVGVQKCGTSTLFDVLSRHNKVIPSKIKEPQFLALPKKVVEKNRKWYENLFEGDNSSMLLDGSTFYYQSKRAWKNIRRFFNNPHIIIIIRDPVRRAHSAHTHMVKQVPTCDLRSFDEIVKKTKKHSEDGVPLYRVEDKIIKEDVERGKVNEEYVNKSYLRKRLGVSFNSKFEDTLWPYRYFTVSEYHKKIEKMKKMFGSSRVKVVVLEKLIEEPSHIIAEIFNFLDLPSELSNRLELPQKNQTKLPKNTLGRTLIWIRRNSSVGSKIWNYFRSGAGPIAKSIWKMVRKPKPTLSKKTYERARGIIEHEYEYWIEKRNNIRSLWSYN